MKVLRRVDCRRAKRLGSVVVKFGYRRESIDAYEWGLQNGFLETLVASDFLEQAGWKLSEVQARIHSTVGITLDSVGAKPGERLGNSPAVDREVRRLLRESPLNFLPQGEQ